MLEAGRFAPSAGNHQPWKFVVVTDKDLIRKLEEACRGVVNMMHSAYHNDAMVMGLIQQLGDPTPIGIFDPRVQGGVGCVARKELPAYLDAPVVIFLAGNDKAAASELQAGICGQNMNLAAHALGLGSLWFTLFDKKPMREILDIGDEKNPLAIVCIGKPAGEPMAAGRKDVKDKTIYIRLGVA